MIGRAAAILLMFAPLAAAVAAGRAKPVDADGVKAAITAIYARYHRAFTAGDALNEEAHYSSRTRALLARWHAAQPADEVTPLGDFDWLCQCQDYDEAGFKITRLIVTSGRGGAWTADVTYYIGWNASNRLRLIMVREGGDWKIDDIIFGPDAGVKSLRAALVAEMSKFKA